MCTFDTVVIEYLIRNFYLAGMNGNSLIYVNNRLQNRLTYLDWNRTLMGPIYDEHGLEQGGINSSDFYKIYNNDMLNIIEEGSQGVDVGGGQTISGVGQADDVALLANDIYLILKIV